MGVSRSHIDIEEIQNAKLEQEEENKKAEEELKEKDEKELH